MSDLQPQSHPLGRPRNDTETTPFHEKALYKLLEQRVPAYVKRGRLDVRGLAAAMEASYQSVYRWLDTCRLSPDAAKMLMKVSDGAIKKDDLLDFVI